MYESGRVLAASSARDMGLSSPKSQRFFKLGMCLKAISLSLSPVCSRMTWASAHLAALGSSLLPSDFYCKVLGDIKRGKEQQALWLSLLRRQEAFRAIWVPFITSDRHPLIYCISVRSFLFTRTAWGPNSCVICRVSSALKRHKILCESESLVTKCMYHFWIFMFFDSCREHYLVIWVLKHLVILFLVWLNHLFKTPYRKSVPSVTLKRDTN